MYLNVMQGDVMQLNTKKSFIGIPDISSYLQTIKQVLLVKRMKTPASKSSTLSVKHSVDPILLLAVM